MKLTAPQKTALKALLKYDEKGCEVHTHSKKYAIRIHPATARSLESKGLAEIYYPFPKVAIHSPEVATRRVRLTEAGYEAVEKLND